VYVASRSDTADWSQKVAAIAAPDGRGRRVSDSGCTHDVVNDAFDGKSPTAVG